MHKTIFRSHDFETERMMAFVPAIGTTITFEGKDFVVESVTIHLTMDFWETPKVTIWMV